MWNTDNCPDVVQLSYENVELKHVAKTMVNCCSNGMAQEPAPRFSVASTILLFYNRNTQQLAPGSGIVHLKAVGLSDATDVS